MGFDEQQRCMGCMRPLAWDGRCNCGFDRESSPSDSHFLPLGSSLKNGDYVVGRVLGRGGFGITYMGFDQNLMDRIAIKEYYPADLAGRDVSGGICDVCAYVGNEEVYQKGLDAFLREARILRQFSAMEGIVKVHNLFEENKTAYIIMEYVEGTSIKNYVQKYGKIEPERVIKMMEQPIRALQAVHEANQIHRDVSADNLMIGRNGKITLIDFGAARSSNIMDERTRTAICKQGYSALEQYSTEGKQGPWTDVYSICATMYYMLTGITPKSSTERVVDDMVVPLSQMDEIPLAQERKEAIMTGMEVMSSKRFQNMKMLYAALYGEQYKMDFAIPKEEKPDIPVDIPVEKEGMDRETGGVTAIIGEVLQKRSEMRGCRKGRRLVVKLAGGVATAVLLALIIWNVRGFFFLEAGVWGQAGRTGKTAVTANVKTTDVKPADTPEPSPKPPKEVKMPKVDGLKRADAIKKLKNKGILYRVVKRNSDTITKGTVIRANVLAGKTVKKGKSVVLYVSKGEKTAGKPKPVAAPEPVATKKPKKKKDDNLAGDLDTILY